MMSEHPHIRRAIEIVGSQAKLAEICGLSQQHISNLLIGLRKPSAASAIAISRSTGGRVRISDIIPEVAGAIAEEIAQSNLPAQEVAA